MNNEERIKHNMEYLKLTRRELEIHEVFVDTSISKFPKSLTDYIKKESEIYGVSGDPLMYWIADWIAGRDKE